MIATTAALPLVSHLRKSSVRCNCVSNVQHGSSVTQRTEIRGNCIQCETVPPQRYVHQSVCMKDSFRVVTRLTSSSYEGESVSSTLRISYIYLSIHTSRYKDFTCFYAITLFLGCQNYICSFHASTFCGECAVLHNPAFRLNWQA